ncbi:hypothetical protein EI94DRAFT_1701243 [Lactarius quietus]|nr:hypothetical protein EI94DRAFT_1701243 [Lactarius quietus]
MGNCCSTPAADDTLPVANREVTSQEQPPPVRPPPVVVGTPEPSSQQSGAKPGRKPSQVSEVPLRKLPTHNRANSAHLPLNSVVRQVLPEHFRFRILIVGKSRSGKSSLVKTVFKVDVTVRPLFFDATLHNRNGYKAAPMKADINVEFRPEDNRYLIVHEFSGLDSQARDSGDLQIIQDFISRRTDPNRSPSERLHAVWVCVPTSDAIDGRVGGGIEGILGLKNVPVVLLFTKFDVVVSQVLFDIGGDAQHYEHSHAPPTRTGVQGEGKEVAAVPLVWSAALRVNYDTIIRASIGVGRSRYWCTLGSSPHFLNRKLKKCVEIIHDDIVEIWNLNDENRYLSSDKFKAKMSHLVKDLADATPGYAQSLYHRVYPQQRPVVPTGPEVRTITQIGYTSCIEAVKRMPVVLRATS